MVFVCLYHNYNYTSVNDIIEVLSFVTSPAVIYSEGTGKFQFLRCLIKVNIQFCKSIPISSVNTDITSRIEN